jgi:hypothetical protein
MRSAIAHLIASAIVTKQGMPVHGKVRNSRKIKVCALLPLDLHCRLQALCGPGRPYRSIGYFLVRTTEKTIAQASKTTKPAPTPAEHPLAPRNDLEWEWTYGLMRYLRAGRGAYPALRQFLAELLRIGH